MIKKKQNIESIMKVFNKGEYNLMVKYKASNFRFLVQVQMFSKKFEFLNGKNK